MAEVFISDLPAASSAAGAEIPIEIDGQPYRVTLAQIIAAVQAAGA